MNGSKLLFLALSLAILGAAGCSNGYHYDRYAYPSYRYGSYPYYDSYYGSRYSRNYGDYPRYRYRYPAPGYRYDDPRYRYDSRHHSRYDRRDHGKHKGWHKQGRSDNHHRGPYMGYARKLEKASRGHR